MFHYRSLGPRQPRLSDITLLFTHTIDMCRFKNLRSYPSSQTSMKDFQGRWPPAFGNSKILRKVYFVRFVKMIINCGSLRELRSQIRRLKYVLHYQNQHRILLPTVYSKCGLRNLVAS